MKIKSLHKKTALRATRRTKAFQNENFELVKRSLYALYFLKIQTPFNKIKGPFLKRNGPY